jgi:hypothetical protein
MAAQDIISYEGLLALARHTAAMTRECPCGLAACAGWERIEVSFPEKQMRVLGTLLKDPYDEPSFTEHHPAGTNYWSGDAPIAVRHFPYNRCSVWQCTVCERCCLMYTEAGGYYVERRIRRLDPQLMVDAAV